MNQLASNPTPFQPAWWSFDLGEYRPCDGTYCFYAYDSIPPIAESQFTGTLDWLQPPEQGSLMPMSEDPHAPGETQHFTPQLEKIAAQAEQLGLTLPPGFLQFMASPELQDRIPSCTACYFSLGKEIIPCPGSENGYLLRFLNDQQDCLLWYLYLTPKGEHCVVVSAYLLDDEEDDSGPLSENAMNNVVRNTQVCAPSFESFLYRFWLENTLWFNLNEAEAPLTDAQRAYLAHYRTKAS
jgi:hypothetical protein